jgi:uncharacterized membrane protein YedE/YeeE
METYIIATLVVGFIAGFLGQRSRMCFVGGIRDLYLIRSTYLFKGLIGFIVAAFIGYIIFNNGISFPWFLEKGALTAIPGAACTVGIAALILAIIGGFGIGLFSVLSGGCPFRNTVMTGEGNKSSLLYLAGFFLGAVVFHLFIFGPLKNLLGCA